LTNNRYHTRTNSEEARYLKRK